MNILKSLRLRKNSAYMKEEIEGEISSGTIHCLVNMLEPILQNSFLLLKI